ncbi:MAG: WbqC family protein [Bacteroidota bacterium]
MVIDLHYLPSLEYFAALLKYEHIYIEAHEHYQKQSYRNRCYIRAANKVDLLSVPILDGNRKILIQDVKIDYQQGWLKDHWRAITSAYGKAPFFEYYAPFFEQLFFKKYTYLFDLNWELLTKCLSLLQIRKNLILTTSYVKLEELLSLDLRSAIHPKKNYLDNKIYQAVPYVQNFGSDFAPNLSIVDLLFCEGTQAKQFLEQSIIPV